MIEIKELINFIEQYFPNFIFLGVVLIPITLLIKWGLTPRNYLEFIDYFFERKVKRIDNDLKSEFLDADQVKYLQNEKKYLVNRQYTGISRRKNQRIIVAIIAKSDGLISPDEFRKVAGFLVNENGVLSLKKNMWFWMIYIFSRSYALLMFIFALLMGVLMVFNDHKNDQVDTVISALLFVVSLFVARSLLTSFVGRGEIEELNIILREEQKKISIEQEQ